MTSITFDRRNIFSNPGLLAWFGLLGLLLLIGLVSALLVFTRGLVVTNMTDVVPWGLWITIDLSAIALGAGAFTLSAIVYIFGLKEFQPIVRLAVFIGFIGYCCALLTLILDIGRPDRFYHPWIYWNVHSVLWEITWCITIYLTILIVEFLPVIAELKFFDRWPNARTIAHRIHGIAPALAVAGLGISLLHQSSLGATYGILKARPIWFKPSMPIMFILSAIAAGPMLTVAMAIIIEWITGKKVAEFKVLQMIARASGVAFLAYGYIKLWDLAATTYYGQTPNVNQALNLLRIQTPYNFSFWVLEVILGIFLPAILFLVPRFNKKPLNLVIGSGFAIFGIIVNRWNVTVSGLFVPLSYSPGTLYQLEPGRYFPSLVEWGVALGIIGFALLMMTLGVRFLPLTSQGEHA